MKLKWKRIEPGWYVDSTETWSVETSNTYGTGLVVNPWRLKRIIEGSKPRELMLRHRKWLGDYPTMAAAKAAAQEQADKLAAT